MKTKLIFLDIDGTLTAPGTNEIPDSALQAIHQAQNAGHLVFLCTGRNYDMLSPLLRYGFDGVIGSSGAYIEIQGSVIYDLPFTPQQTAAAMEVLERHHIFRTVECADGAFTDSGLKEFLQAHRSEGENSELLRIRQQVEQALNIRPMEEYHGQPIYKIVLMSLSQEHLELARAELGTMFHFVLQDSSADTVFNGELTGTDYDKGMALRRVCRFLNRDISDAIGFGDSMNDLELLQTVGTSLCMENGSEALKAWADIICPAWNKDGIYRAFEQLKLLEEEAAQMQ